MTCHLFSLEMGGTSSTPVSSDDSSSAAVVSQTPTSACPVQHTLPAPNRTSQPSVSECPAHQDSRVNLQTSQCPVSAGGGCDSSAMDEGVDVLDPSNMVIKLMLFIMFLNYVQDLKIIFKKLPISMFQQCMLYYFDTLYVVNQQMYIPSYFLV